MKYIAVVFGVIRISLISYRRSLFFLRLRQKSRLPLLFSPCFILRVTPYSRHTALFMQCKIFFRLCQTKVIIRTNCDVAAKSASRLKNSLCLFQDVSTGLFVTVTGEEVVLQATDLRNVCRFEAWQRQVRGTDWH